MTGGIEGVLSGEFLRTTGLPDSRCRFKANDESLFLLCYFKQGRKLKGPQIKYIREKEQVEIRSQTWMANGNEIFTLALIQKDMPG